MRDDTYIEHGVFIETMLSGATIDRARVDAAGLTLDLNYGATLLLPMSKPQIVTLQRGVPPKAGAPIPVNRDRGPNDWFRTFSGVHFYPFDPRPEDIRIEDMAHNLSRLPRFLGGTIGEPYSIAQHCVAASYIVTAPTPALLPVYQLGTLLHDGEEAYFNDLPRPLKHHADMLGYRAGGTRLLQMIFDVFGVTAPIDAPEIKAADNAMLAIERRELQPTYYDDHPDEPRQAPELFVVGWREARAMFAERFQFLSARVKKAAHA